MRLGNWYDWLFPSVRFESQGGSSERFLSDCLQSFLPLTRVQPTAYGFCASIPAARYRQLHPLARRHHCRLHVLKKSGLWFRLRPLLRRNGLLAGVALALLLTLAVPGRVWNVEYYGLSAADRQLLGDALFRSGIYQGCIVTEVSLQEARQRVLIQTDRFAALSLNYGKGKLVVEASPVTQAPALLVGQSRDICAAADGVIRSAQVYSGVCMVQAGQSVKKGEVLVRASWQDQQGAQVPVACRARIMAYVEKSAATACPLTQQTSVVTRTETDSLALCFGAKKLWLKKGGDAAAVGAQQGVRLLGVSLPLTVYRTLRSVRSPQTLHLTQAQARQRCRETLNAMLYAQLPGMQVLSREYTYELVDQTMYCTVHLRAYADIAAQNEQQEAA